MSLYKPGAECGDLLAGLRSEVLLCLSNQIEAASDADEVFFGDGAVCNLKRPSEVGSNLRHLSIQLDISCGQLLRIGRTNVVDVGEDYLVSAAGDSLKHAGHVLVRAASEDHDHAVVGNVLADRAHHGIN